MERLKISTTAQANIDEIWYDLDDEEWSSIEDEALRRLNESLKATINSTLSHVQSDPPRENIVFDQSEVDDAVLEAAFWVLDSSRYKGGNEIFHDLEPKLSTLPYWFSRLSFALHLHAPFKKLKQSCLLKLASLEDLSRAIVICISV
mmetsp:Transcript_15874/g.25808  ORF Transcript_15874/g.25808 Transcript_15874/m.25808 type:complete len:147 (+) Transcript_15874:71-511(+)